jgi:hypothetical protein
MTKDEVLTQISQKEIKPKQAYRMLYPHTKQRKPRRASFVKIHVHANEGKAINIFLGIILLLPIPIFLIKWIVGRRANVVLNEDLNITAGEFLQMISVRGVRIEVRSKDNERVLVKTI